MALALRLAPKGMIEDLITVGIGALDGYLLDTNVMAFLAKNLAVVGLDKFGILKLPEFLVKESESMLGIVLYALIKGLVK